MEKVKPKIKLDIRIDCYENGCGVIIKRLVDRKVVGGRVFFNEQEKEMKAWIEATKERAIKEWSEIKKEQNSKIPFEPIAVKGECVACHRERYLNDEKLCIECKFTGI
jgi:formylmethanofuran dehydrogenase subunit E